MKWVMLLVCSAAAATVSAGDATGWNGHGIAAAICHYDGLGESPDLGRSGFRIYNNSTTQRLRVICPLLNQGIGPFDVDGTTNVSVTVRDGHPEQAVECNAYCRDKDGSVLESAAVASTGSTGSAQTLSMKFTGDHCFGAAGANVTVECEMPPRFSTAGYSKINSIAYSTDGF